MCRHLCYLGPPATLASVVLDPPHSLLVQSYAPTDMRGAGSVNADGFGVGWHTEAGVVHYRRSVPIWQDRGFAQLAATTRSTAVLASVRNATVGMPISDAANAPFVGDGWMFSLNGRIDGWPASAVKLAESLDIEDLLTLDAPTDAALLWAVVRSRLRLGRPPGDVLREVITETLAAAADSRLNLLLTDGDTAWGSTVTHALWARLDPAILASEPFDDDSAWQEIPGQSLVRLDRDALSIEPLNG